MGDDRRIGEAILVVIAIVALLVSAAFLPTVDIFGSNEAIAEQLPDGSQLPAGTQSPGGPAAGTQAGDQSGDMESTGDGESGESQSARSGEPTGIGAPGQTAGGSLTNPPQSAQISGSLGEQPSQVPLFTVESPVNTYWRQTAYETYTGTGWQQAGATTPLDEGIPNDDRTGGNRRITYDVTLLEGGRSLPTAWQPESVSFRGDDSRPALQASTTGGVQADEPLSAETTYTATSVLPPRQPSVLRNAGGQTPREIREPYTRMPSDTPDRVGEFTGELLAGTDTRYDRAITVQRWLKSNKGYSLNTSLDPSQPIADQLLFEVDAAYCQQFATTMAAMLRSQGVPARYVVGFRNGKAVGDDTYLVTSDRGHAWVEVYFPDVGWVRFDPTPADELSVSTPAPPYEVSLNRSAVVGAPVSVRVTKQNESISGVPVFVNDGRVGWTDATGAAETTLPYTDRVTIRAGDDTAQTEYTDATPPPQESQLAAASIGVITNSLPLLSAATPLTPENTVTSQVDGETADSTATYPLAKNATLAVVGNRRAGETARVVASVEEIPISEATVSFDGTEVGTTNQDGYYDLSLADVTPGTYRITVSRGAVSESTTFEVIPPTAETPNDEPTALTPNISVTPVGIALPAGPATATVTRSGEPVDGVSVRVNGETVGETDENGTLGLKFPIADTALVATTVTGVTGETQIDGLYGNAALVGGGILLLIAGIVTAARRRGVTSGSVRERLEVIRAFLRRLPERATTLLVGLADRLTTAMRRLLARLRAWRSVFALSVSEIQQRLDPRRLVAALRSWLERLRRRWQAATGNADTQAAPGEASGTGPDRQLRSMWQTFVSLIRPPQAVTRTPVEVGQYAIEKGVPSQPVTYLTDLYRAVEYGQQSPGDSRLEAARQALAEITESSEDDDP